MPPEAKLEKTEHGVRAAEAGWFVVNLANAEWAENGMFGQWSKLEGPDGFPHFGINVHVIQPGQPSCRYHEESAQEAFLVLRGECILLVEEEERHLRAWDFVHCPPGTKHVFVGAGDGPCAILMVGHRPESNAIRYPSSELARQHRAGVDEETSSPKVAYADAPESSEIKAPFPPA